jgi:hypothetical protein
VEAVIRDVEFPAGRAPSPGFSLLMRLLSKDPPRSGPHLPDLRSMVLQIVVGYSERDRRALLEGGAIGADRLAREARLREHRAWSEALQVFDGEPRPPRWVAPADEVAWHEQAVLMALTLLNNLMVKDVRFKDLHARLTADGHEHAYFASLASGVLALHECISPLPLDRSGRATREQLLPIVAVYTASDLLSPIRLQVRKRRTPSARVHARIGQQPIPNQVDRSPRTQGTADQPLPRDHPSHPQAALFLRAMMERFRSPGQLLRLFPMASSDMMQDCVQAVIRTITDAGSPVEDYALELGSLHQALSLVARTRLDDGKVSA